MQPSTKRGWRGALLALVVVVWLYGCVLVSLGGYTAVATFTLLMGLVAAGVTRATREAGTRRGGA